MPSELTLLENVLLKLAMSDTDEKLQKNLELFLPAVLLKGTSADAKVRQKVMEILQHVNKVTKSRPKLALPVDKLVIQFGDPKVAAPVKNFTKIYICSGWPRLSFEKQIELAPKLLRGLGGRSESHVRAMLLLLLPILGSMPHPPSGDDDRMEFLGLSDKTLRSVVMNILLDVMRLNNASRQPLLPKEGETLLPPPPSGMSRSALVSIVGKTGTTPMFDHGDKIVALKRSIIKFLSFFGETRMIEILPHMLIGCGDGHHQVVSDADSTIRRLVGKTEQHSPEVATIMFDLLLGTPKGVSAVQPNDRRSVAGPNLRQVLLGHILKSNSAAVTFPSVTDAIHMAVFGNDSHSRVRVLGLQLFHRMAELGSKVMLEQYSIPLLKQIIRLLEDPELEPEIQSLAYGSIGKMARELGSLFHDDFDLLQKLFVASHSSPGQVRPYVRDALSMIRKHYANPNSVTAARIVELLNKYIAREESGSRLLAVEFANALFSKNHLQSRMVCLMGAVDINTDVVVEANRGIRRALEIDKDDKTSSSDEVAQFPNFKDAVLFFWNDSNTAVSKMQKLDNVSDSAVVDAGILPYPQSVYLQMLKYLRHLLGFSSGVFEDQATYELETGRTYGRIVEIAKHLDNIEIAVATSASESIVQYFRQLIEMALIPSSSSELQDEAIECLLELVAAIPAGLSTVYVNRLPWLKPFMSSTNEITRENTGRLIGFVAAELEADDFRKLIDDLSDIIQSPRQHSLEDRHGALGALGFVLSSMYRQPEEWRPLAPDAISKSLMIIIKELDNSDQLMVCAACKALGALGQVGPLPSLRTVEAESDQPPLAKDIIKKLQKLSVSVSKSKSTRINEAAILCMGSFSVGEFPHMHFDDLLSGLCRVAEIKNIELQFSVGQAICSTAVGPLCVVALDTWYPTAAIDTEEDASVLSKKPRIDETRLSTAVQLILKKWAYHPQAWARQSAGIWFVSILKHCGKFKEIELWLGHVQSVFTNLLAEGDEFAQDIASKGLGLLYEIGDQDTKKALVRVLVQTLSEGSRSQARKYGGNTSDEVVFEPGQLGTAPTEEAASGKRGGGISTYKELCSIASDLNQPDLIYKFMQLANHNTMWNSRKGAAFGFASIAHQAREELSSYLPELVPKLYRYQFDPNPNVHNAMTNIWKIVVIEPAKAIDTYIVPILDDLTTSISNSQWRIREACCSAISDILRGRRWVQLKSHFVQLWQMLFRALDDVKESVRVAAFSACKRLGKVTVTMCSTEDSSNSREAVAVALPVLINSGLLSQVDEIRGFSLGIMIELSKEAGPALRPHVTDFMIVLLEALSGLESSVLNYVATRIDDKDRMQDQLENARISAAKSGPMTECINRLLDYTDDTALPTLIPRLCDVIRHGLGSATKSGCAHVAGRLATKFRQHFNGYSRQLLKALIRGAVQTSAPVRRDYATAIGLITRAATANDVDMVIKECHKLYLERESEEAMVTSAAICRGIALQASDILTAVATKVLPLSFLGMHDSSEVTKSLWSELWSEHTPGTEGGIKLYAVDILNLSLPCLSSRSWHVKKQGAAALTAVAKNAYKGAMNDFIAQVVDELAKVLDGRTWDGKEALVKALVASAISCKNHLNENAILREKIDTAVLKEIRKNAIDYRVAILPHAAAYFNNFQSPSLLGELVDLLCPELVADETDADENDTIALKKAESKKKESLKSAILSFFESALKPGALPRLESFSTLWSALLHSLIQSEWRNKTRVCDCIAYVFKSINTTSEAKEVAVAVDYSEILAGHVIELLKSIVSVINDAKQTTARKSGLITLKEGLNWVVLHKSGSHSEIAQDFKSTCVDMTIESLQSAKRDIELSVVKLADEVLTICRKL